MSAPAQRHIHGSWLQTLRNKTWEGKQKQFFDLAKAFEQCILVKDVQKYRAAKQVKRGFVRAVIANFIMYVLFGMGYSSLDPSARATLLNLNISGGQLRCTS